MLHPIIENLARQHPLWVLLDADYAHTKQSIPFMKYCKKIVSVGRVKWIEDSKYSGKDNVVWMLFHDTHYTGINYDFNRFVNHENKTEFIGRI